LPSRAQTELGLATRVRETDDGKALEDHIPLGIPRYDDAGNREPGNRALPSRR